MLMRMSSVCLCVLTDAEILDIVLDKDGEQTEEPGEIPQIKENPTSNLTKEAVGLLMEYFENSVFAITSDIPAEQHVMKGQ